MGTKRWIFIYVIKNLYQNSHFSCCAHLILSNIIMSSTILAVDMFLPLDTLFTNTLYNSLEHSSFTNMTIRKLISVIRFWKASSSVMISYVHPCVCLSLSLCKWERKIERHDISFIASSTLATAKMQEQILGIYIFGLKILQLKLETKWNFLKHLCASDCKHVKILYVENCLF